MKKVLGLVLALGMVGGVLGGCAYGGVSVNAAGDKAVVMRNDSFLFGALRTAYVCKVTDEGLSDCKEGDAP